MKEILKICLFALFAVSACVSPAKTPEIQKPETSKIDEISKVAATELHKLLANNNQNVELKDGKIISGKKVIEVSVVTEHSLEKDGKWIFAGRFETKLTENEVNNFTVGYIGIGDNKQDAINTSIQEWLNLFGTALEGMILNSESVLKFDNFKVFAGNTGIRGNPPIHSWNNGSEEMNRKIIAQLLPLIKKINKDINFINLMLTVNEKGEIDGECRINNEVSQEIIAE